MFGPLKHSGHYMYHQFNIQQLYVLPTQCILVFCVDLRTAIFSPFNIIRLPFITDIYPFKAQWSLYVPSVYIHQLYVLPTQCIFVFCVDL